MAEMQLDSLRLSVLEMVLKIGSCTERSELQQLDDLYIKAKFEFSIILLKN